MKGYVYIIQSLKNQSFYIGSSTDYKRRLCQHNSGNVQSTKYKRPYKLVFVQQFNSLEEANKIELKLKRWKRRDFIEKIIEDGRINFMDA